MRDVDKPMYYIVRSIAQSSSQSGENHSMLVKIGVIALLCILGVSVVSCISRITDHGFKQGGIRVMVVNVIPPCPPNLKYFSFDQPLYIYLLYML